MLMSTRHSFTLPETSPTQRTAVGERILIGRDAGYTQPVAPTTNGANPFAAGFAGNMTAPMAMQQPPVAQQPVAPAPQAPAQPAAQAETTTTDTTVTL